MYNIEIPHKNKSLSLFHINVCSLYKIFYDLQLLLIIAIGETRITKNVSLVNNLNLNNYSFEFTLTETSAGGTLLYIANHLSYKCCNDLNIYKKWTGIYFYWNCQCQKIKYCGSHLQTSIYGPYWLNCNYLNKLLNNISKEQISVFVLGDFNVSLLNYNEHS